MRKPKYELMEALTYAAAKASVLLKGKAAIGDVLWETFEINNIDPSGFIHDPEGFTVFQHMREDADALYHQLETGDQTTQLPEAT